jgi:hypothetical protein
MSTPVCALVCGDFDFFMKNFEMVANLGKTVFLIGAILGALSFYNKFLSLHSDPKRNIIIKSTNKKKCTDINKRKSCTQLQWK